MTQLPSHSRIVEQVSRAEERAQLQVERLHHRLGLDQGVPQGVAPSVPRVGAQAHQIADRNRRAMLQAQFGRTVPTGRVEGPPTMLGEIGKSIPRTMLGLVEGAGGMLMTLGAFSPELRAVGNRLAEYGQELQEPYMPHPEAMTGEWADLWNPYWWAAVLPGEAAMLGVQILTAGGLRAIQMNRLSQAAFYTPTAVRYGGIAAKRSYDRGLAEGMTEDEAGRQAALVGFLTATGTTALARVPYGEFVLRYTPGSSRKFIENLAMKQSPLMAAAARGAAVEGLTEFAQEAWVDTVQWVVENDPQAFEGSLVRYVQAAVVGGVLGSAANWTMTKAMMPTEAQIEAQLEKDLGRLRPMLEAAGLSATTIETKFNRVREELRPLRDLKTREKKLREILPELKQHERDVVRAATESNLIPLEEATAILGTDLAVSEAPMDGRAYAAEQAAQQMVDDFLLDDMTVAVWAGEGHPTRDQPGDDLETRRQEVLNDARPYAQEAAYLGSMLATFGVDPTIAEGLVDNQLKEWYQDADPLISESLYYHTLLHLQEHSDPHMMARAEAVRDHVLFYTTDRGRIDLTGEIQSVDAMIEQMFPDSSPANRAEVRFAIEETIKQELEFGHVTEFDLDLGDATVTPPTQERETVRSQDGQSVSVRPDPVGRRGPQPTQRRDPMTRRRRPTPTRDPAPAAEPTAEPTTAEPTTEPVADPTDREQVEAQFRQDIQRMGSRNLSALIRAFRSLNEDVDQRIRERGGVKGLNDEQKLRLINRIVDEYGLNAEQRERLRAEYEFQMRATRKERQEAMRRRREQWQQARRRSQKAREETPQNQSYRPNEPMHRNQSPSRRTGLAIRLTDGTIENVPEGMTHEQFIEQAMDEGASEQLFDGAQFGQVDGNGNFVNERTSNAEDVGHAVQDQPREVEVEREWPVEAAFIPEGYTGDTTWAKNVPRTTGDATLDAQLRASANRLGVPISTVDVGQLTETQAALVSDLTMLAKKAAPRNKKATIRVVPLSSAPVSGWRMGDTIFVNMGERHINNIWVTMAHEMAHVFGWDQRLELTPEWMDRLRSAYLKLVVGAWGREAAEALAQDREKLDREARALFIGEALRKSDWQKRILASRDEGHHKMYEELVKAAREWLKFSGRTEMTRTTMEAKRKIAEILNQRVDPKDREVLLEEDSTDARIFEIALRNAWEQSPGFSGENEWRHWQVQSVEYELDAVRTLRKDYKETGRVNMLKVYGLVSGSAGYVKMIAGKLAQQQGRGNDTGLIETLFHSGMTKFVEMLTKRGKGGRFKWQDWNYTGARAAYTKHLRKVREKAANRLEPVLAQARKDGLDQDVGELELAISVLRSDAQMTMTFDRPVQGAPPSVRSTIQVLHSRLSERSKRRIWPKENQPAWAKGKNVPFSEEWFQLGSEGIVRLAKYVVGSERKGQRQSVSQHMYRVLKGDITEFISVEHESATQAQHDGTTTANQAEDGVRTRMIQQVQDEIARVRQENPQIPINQLIAVVQQNLRDERGQPLVDPDILDTLTVESVNRHIHTLDRNRAEKEESVQGAIERLYLKALKDNDQQRLGMEGMERIAEQITRQFGVPVNAETVISNLRELADEGRISRPETRNQPVSPASPSPQPSPTTPEVPKLRREQLDERSPEAHMLYLAQVESLAYEGIHREMQARHRRFDEQAKLLKAKMKGLDKRAQEDLQKDVRFYERKAAETLKYIGEGWQDAISDGIEQELSRHDQDFDLLPDGAPQDPNQFNDPSFVAQLAGTQVRYGPDHPRNGQPKVMYMAAMGNRALDTTMPPLLQAVREPHVAVMEKLLNNPASRRITEHLSKQEGTKNIANWSNRGVNRLRRWIRANAERPEIADSGLFAETIGHLRTIPVFANIQKPLPIADPFPHYDLQPQKAHIPTFIRTAKREEATWVAEALGYVPQYADELMVPDITREQAIEIAEEALRDVGERIAPVMRLFSSRLDQDPESMLLAPEELQTVFNDALMNDRALAELYNESPVIREYVSDWLQEIRDLTDDARSDWVSERENAIARNITRELGKTKIPGTDELVLSELQVEETLRSDIPAEHLLQALRVQGYDGFIFTDKTYSDGNGDMAWLPLHSNQIVPERRAGRRGIEVDVTDSNIIPILDPDNIDFSPDSSARVDMPRSNVRYSRKWLSKQNSKKLKEIAERHDIDMSRVRKGKGRKNDLMAEILENQARYDRSRAWQNEQSRMIEEAFREVFHLDEPGAINLDPDAPRVNLESTQPADQTTIERMTQVIEASELRRSNQEVMNAAERAKRATRVEKILQRAEGRQSVRRLGRALKGEFPAPGIEAPINQLTPTELDQIFDHFRTHPIWQAENPLRQAGAMIDFSAFLSSGTTPQAHQIELWSRIFGKDFGQALSAKRSWVDRLGQFALDAINIPRVAVASHDVSFTARQGLVILLSELMKGRAHRTVLPAYKAQIKALFSEDFARQTEASWKAHPNEATRQHADLFRASIDPALNRFADREEIYASQLWQNLGDADLHGMARLIKPLQWHSKVVRGSERGALTYLNTLRNQVFDMMAAQLREAGYSDNPNHPDFAEYRNAAHLINSATGRGNFSMFGNAFMNSMFFAPRFMTSRFEHIFWQLPKNALNPNTPAPIRREAMTQILGLSVFWLGLASLVKAAAAIYEPEDKVDVGLDPFDSDFLKFRVGDSRVDLGAGFGQVIRLVAGVGAGVRGTSKSGLRRVGEDGELTDDDPLDALKRFFHYKMGPTPSTGMSILRGRGPVGDPVTPTTVVRDLSLPISIANLKDLWEENQGLGLLLWTAEIHGFGTGVYSREPRRPGDPDYQAEPRRTDQLIGGLLYGDTDYFRQER